MIKAAVAAFQDLGSPPFRAVLLKALGLTLALFIAVLLGTELAIVKLTKLPWPWAQSLLEFGAGLALVVAFFFLMAPVIAMFAGVFLDGIAARVEALHYPGDRPGQPLPMGRALMTGIQFAALVLAVDLAALPLVFTGIGAPLLIGINAYLIGREYFELAAMRHMAVEEARQLRRDNSPTVLVAGLVPAVLAMVPLANIFVPLFATAYFTHIFKQVAASSD
jgi:CysZ protein